MRKSILNVFCGYQARYEKQFEEIKNRSAYWDLLNKKMMELNLNNVEQKLIKDDFLKQEALMYREKYWQS
jgi:hypothetical protein